ncbi:MAG: cache domain-containing protein [Bacteroidales bacterium]|nr:cache domain-containing protein [Bacteroidales bacterium]
MINFRHNISNIFLLYSTGFTVLAVVLLSVIYSILEIKDFEKESQKHRESFILKQQEVIQNETVKAIDYINLTRLFIEDNMQKNLVEKVNTAWDICNNIYSENIHSQSKDKIKKTIKDALRPIRFFNDRGYYFIVSMDGTEELFPIAPQLEGENLINLQDKKGNFVIQDEIEIIKKSGEGFVTDYWAKPGSDQSMIYPKNSYIKYFEPLDWYIGCGEYIDNFEKDLQQQVLQRISSIRYGKNGYVFVNTYDGTALLMDGKIIEEPISVWELEDPKGVKVIQEERKAVENPEGDFIHYSWRKLHADEVLPKMSFIKGIPEWEWMVGAGIYIDEIDEEIEKEKSILYSHLRKRVLTGVIVLLTIILIVFIVARRISHRIKTNFESFTNKLTKAVESGELLNENDFSIHNIKNAIDSINGIIYNKIVAERLLKENEILFRTLFENVPVLINILDNHFNIRLSNKEMKTFCNLIPEFSSNKLNLIDIIANTGYKEIVQSQLNKFDGQFREFEINTTDGIKTQNWAAYKTETEEFIAVGYDISELKENQQKLKDVNETKDKFFSLISHDLHGPFNTIIGFSEILLNKYDTLSDEKQLKYIDQIHKSSQGMHRLLMNLLNWARSQSGIIEVANENFNLNEIVNEILNILNPQAIKKNIQILNNVNKSHEVYGDKSMINTIIQNITANSIKFTNPQGIIELKSEVKNNKIFFSIKDNGVGIKKENLQNLFKLDNSKNSRGTENESGTGLGLIICKEFIEKMGEEIWVESAEGVGTTFFFSLKKNL